MHAEIFHFFVTFVLFIKCLNKTYQWHTYNLRKKTFFGWTCISCPMIFSWAWPLEIFMQVLNRIWRDELWMKNFMPGFRAPKDHLSIESQRRIYPGDPGRILKERVILSFSYMYFLTTPAIRKTVMKVPFETHRFVGSTIKLRLYSHLWNGRARASCGSLVRDTQKHRVV